MPKSWVLPAQDLIFQLLPGMILPLISNSGSRKEVLSRSKRPPEANRPLELTQRRRLCAFSGPGEAPCVEEKCDSGCFQGPRPGWQEGPLLWPTRSAKRPKTSNQLTIGMQLRAQQESTCNC